MVADWKPLRRRCSEHRWLWLRDERNRNWSWHHGWPGGEEHHNLLLLQSTNTSEQGDQLFGKNPGWENPLFGNNQLILEIVLGFKQSLQRESVKKNFFSHIFNSKRVKRRNLNKNLKLGWFFPPLWWLFINNDSRQRCLMIVLFLILEWSAGKQSQQHQQYNCVDWRWCQERLYCTCQVHTALMKYF